MTRHLMLVTCAAFALLTAEKGNGRTSDSWPDTVLISNDNGIKDVKIIELARAFSEVSRTFVAASLEDQSGTSNYNTVIRKGSIRVVPREIGEDIVAFGVDGYPADCVLFGVFGPLQDEPPDLVISGINGGPNLGPEWFGSGTIGAARTAALLGIPAIAVSGLDDSDPDAVARATRWVVDLACSEYVRDMQPGDYLTVSIPVGPPDRIKGVRVARRAPIPMQAMTLQRSDRGDESDGETWRVVVDPAKIPAPQSSDVDAYAQGYIVVVPMNVDEHDAIAQERLSKQIEQLPSW